MSENDNDDTYNPDRLIDIPQSGEEYDYKKNNRNLLFPYEKFDVKYTASNTKKSKTTKKNICNNSKMHILTIYLIFFFIIMVIFGLAYVFPNMNYTNANCLIITCTNNGTITFSYNTIVKTQTITVNTCTNYIINGTISCWYNNNDIADTLSITNNESLLYHTIFTFFIIILFIVVIICVISIRQSCIIFLKQ